MRECSRSGSVRECPLRAWTEADAPRADELMQVCSRSGSVRECPDGARTEVAAPRADELIARFVACLVALAMMLGIAASASAQPLQEEIAAPAPVAAETLDRPSDVGVAIA